MFIRLPGIGVGVLAFISSTHNYCMKRTPILWKAALSLALAVTASDGRAASLLLDFGPTTVASTESLLDMGHFSGAVPTNQISWNKIVNADNSSLVFADGSAATGVSVTIGRSDLGISNDIDFNSKSVTSSALGGQLNIGIYTNTSPIKDGIFATGTATVNTNAVGIRVNGLAAGTYTLYISGRNTSTAATAPQEFFATNGPSAASFAFGTNDSFGVESNLASAPGGTLTQADAITSTFAYGDNCILVTVTLNSGDSLFLAAIGIATNEFRGFLNSVAIASGQPVLTNFPATIVIQPANLIGWEGSTVTFKNVKFGGVPPLFYQWYFQSNAITNATNSTLTLSNITTLQGGIYNVSVANSIATNFSSNAVLTVLTINNTAQMTNIWNLLPGDRAYLTSTTSSNNERGIAYDGATGQVLLVAQSPSDAIVALDAATGAENHFMNLSGITATGASGVNMIGVADDGTVYVGNATVNAGSSSTPYSLFQWPDDSPASTAIEIFSGDPGFGTPAAGLRWGDNIAVRGSGASTQILIAPGTGTNVCLFTTPDGFNFVQNIITISNVPSGFAQFGLAFGPGGNTFWAKTYNQQLNLVQFDLGTDLGEPIYSASTNDVPLTYRLISTDTNQHWMAGIFTANSSLPDSVRLYDISNYTNGFVQADQELYATANHSSFLNGVGTGSTAFGGNYLFALDSNNGIKAFQINTNAVIPPGPFSITSVTSQSGAAIAFTWQSVAGHNYQVQGRESLTSGSWTNVGASVMASGTSTSVTNAITGDAQFYRVYGQ